jgi:hypothetical protein
MRTLGIDPGFTHVGVTIFDGCSVIMARVNLTVEKHDNEFVKIDLNESHYIETVRSFVTRNYELLTTVQRFATEKQIKPELISFELAILAYLKGTFPHADVLRVCSKQTREFFNTSVKNDALSEDHAYQCRKRLSVEVLYNIFNSGTITLIQAKMGDKLDDAAESCLLAIYVWYMTIRQRPVLATGHLMRRITATVKFESRNDLPLTPEQRRPIVQEFMAKTAAMMEAATGLPTAKPRKRKAPDASASPKKHKASRFFTRASV